jgi:hypothetical protein
VKLFFFQFFSGGEPERKKLLFIPRHRPIISNLVAYPLLPLIRKCEKTSALFENTMWVARCPVFKYNLFEVRIYRFIRKRYEKAWFL